MVENVFPKDALKSVDFSKRVSGGSSWTDSIFRKQADTKSYAKKMIGNVIRQNDLLEQGIECFFEESHFIITRNEKLLVIKGFAFVEQHRQQGTHSFEEWLRQLLAK